MAAQNNAPNALTVRRLLLRAPLQVAVLIALVFGPAGTFAWMQGWVLVILSVVSGVAMTAWLYAKSPALLKERLGPLLQKDQPRADKVVTMAFLATVLAWFAFLPFDAVRLHLLPAPPAPLAWLGLAGWFASAWLIYLAFRENAYAAPIVKHVAEQKVVDTGPYAVVRHPMYAALLVYALGVPLWLGSTAGVLLAAMPLGVLVLRLLIEERHLRRTLPGYDAYMHKVRWRVVPGVW